jgi:hypothetical protein
MAPRAVPDSKESGAALDSLHGPRFISESRVIAAYAKVILKYSFRSRLWCKTQIHLLLAFAFSGVFIDCSDSAQ